MTIAAPKAFAVWFKDLDRWGVHSFATVDWRWPQSAIKRLSGALTRKFVPAQAEVLQFPLVTLHFDGKMELRDRGSTRSIKSRLWLAAPGDVIYSKIDARNGAIGVVPKHLGEICVTSEYPVYSVVPEVADAQYIKLLFRTPTFRRKINSMVSGTSGRKRVQAADLETVEVPLPSLETQRRIVAAWENAQAEIAAMRQQIATVEERVETGFLHTLGLSVPVLAELPKAFALWWEELERWSVMFNQLATTQIDLASGKHPITTLGEIAAVSYGIQKSPANRPGDHARPYLRVANVQRGVLDLGEVKTINVPDTELPTFRLEPGDLLFVEGNGSRKELGRCALWRGEIENCVHQNHILKVRPEANRLLPEYAMTWFNTQLGKEHFFRSVKTSSGLGTINSSELRNAPIPLPPLDVQRELVCIVTTHRENIERLNAELKQKAELVKADIEAMILGAKPVPMQ